MEVNCKKCSVSWTGYHLDQVLTYFVHTWPKCFMFLLLTLEHCFSKKNSHWLIIWYTYLINQLKTLFHEISLGYHYSQKAADWLNMTESHLLANQEVLLIGFYCSFPSYQLFVEQMCANFSNGIIIINLYIDRFVDVLFTMH